MTSLFPFTQPQRHFMQKAAVALIESPSFVFKLPALSERSWTLVNHPSDERERLEFLGDALIGSCVSEELFCCRPDEGPHFYSHARSVLTANSTFAHLMHKVGLFRRGNLVKPAGDAYETILAAYHAEKGPDALKAYVRTYFVPLISCVSKAFDRYRKARFRTRKVLSVGLDSQRRRVDHARSRFLAKAKKQPTKHSKTAYRNRPVLGLSALGVPKAPPVVIDLTADDEDTASCHLITRLKEAPKASTPAAISHSKAMDIDNAVHLTASQRREQAGTAVGQPNVGMEGVASVLCASNAHTTPLLSSTRGSYSNVAEASSVSVARAVQRDVSKSKPHPGRALVLGSVDNPILID